MRLSNQYKIIRLAAHAEEVPPAPGTQPIPDDHVRVYHYTGSYKGGQTLQNEEQMADNLRSNGIDIGRARGHTYKEPDMVWASTKPPGDHKVFAEFDVHKDDPRWGIGRPRMTQDLDWLNKGNIDVTFNGSIRPDEILAVHVPWHNTYRYLKENNMFPAVLRGDYDYLLENPENREAQAINYIKKHHVLSSKTSHRMGERVTDYTEWDDDGSSDREHPYFGVGHGDFSEEHSFVPSYVVWVMIEGELRVSREIGPDSEDSATHGTLWGHDRIEGYYKGRYEPETGRLTIVKPERYRFRELPDVLWAALRSKFKNIGEVRVF